MGLLRAEAKALHLVEDLVGGFGTSKGLPCSLCASTYARMASRSCGMLGWDLRLSAFSVSNPKNRSTRGYIPFIQKRSSGSEPTLSGKVFLIFPPSKRLLKQ